MKGQGRSEGIVHDSFTAEVFELKATNTHIEVELEGARSRVNDCPRSGLSPTNSTTRYKFLSRKIRACGMS
jgi:hypothetical protein